MTEVIATLITNNWFIISTINCNLNNYKLEVYVCEMQL